MVVIKRGEMTGFNSCRKCGKNDGFCDDCQCDEIDGLIGSVQ